MVQVLIPRIAKDTPVENSLLEELAKNGITKDTFNSSLKLEKRAAVNTRILTNLKNMWNDSKIFMKLLDHLLLTILKLHLAAVRTRKYMKYLADKKEESDNKQHKEAVSGITSTGRRELVRLEHKKKMKYDQKFQATANERYSIQAKKCDERIGYFKSIKSLPVRSKFQFNGSLLTSIKLSAPLKPMTKIKKMLMIR